MNNIKTQENIFLITLINLIPLINSITLIRAGTLEFDGVAM